MLFSNIVASSARIALLYTTVLVFFAFPISNALANICLLLMLLLWLSSGQWQEKWTSIKSNPGLWFAIGLYAWMWIGITYSDAPSTDIQDHLRKYIKLLLMVVVVTTFTEKYWRRRAWQAYGFALLITLASTYINIWFDLPWSVSFNQGWGQDHTVFKDYISQGILVSMFIAICLTRIVKQELTILQRFIWGALAILGVLSITHLSWGRSGYLALAAVLLGFTYQALMGWKRWLCLAMIPLVLLGIYSTSEVMQERIKLAIHEVKNHSIEDYSSIGQRIYYANKSIELIKQKPLLGWGTGAYHSEFCKIADTEQWCKLGSIHPHNQFLFIWVEHGIMGLMMLIGLILSPILITKNASPGYRGVAYAYSSIFVIISMTHGSLWLSTESHFHTLMGALILSSYKNKSLQKADQL